MEEALGNAAVLDTRSRWRRLLAATALLCSGVALVERGAAQTNSDLSSFLAVDPVMLGNEPVTLPGSSEPYLPVTVRLRNVSSKPVTAYEISLNIENSDGTSKTTGWTEDLAFPIAAASVPGALPIPNTTLNPGDAHSITQHIPLDRSGARPVQVLPRIVLLVFGDRTGLGDPKKVSLVFAGRRQISEHLANLVTMVREAEASPRPEDRYRQIIAANRLQEPGRGPLGAYSKRIEKYLAVRGTPEADLMLKIDEAVRDGLLEQSVPAGGQQQ